MSFLDGLKKAVLVDEATPAARPAVATAATAAAVMQPATSGAAPPDSQIYQRILAKTRYEDTRVGGVIHKYLSALDGLPLDDAMKLKTAIAQAKKIDGVVDGDVLDVFKALAQRLDEEAARFREAATANEQEQISAREKRVLTLSQEIQERQAVILQLSAELSEAKTQHAAMQGSFLGSLARRKEELAAELTHYTAAIGSTAAAKG